MLTMYSHFASQKHLCLVADSAMALGRHICVKLWITAFACIHFVVPSHADENVNDLDGRLANHEIRTALIGKTLLGTYGGGEPWRETYFVDDGLDYQDETGRSGGNWSAQDNLLCTYYDEPTMNGGCFVVIRRSANCHDFYAVDPVTKIPFASPEAIRSAIDWSARGWRSDQISTCPHAFIS